MLNCPTCHQPIDDAPDLAGQMVACPACGGLMTMPVIGQLIVPDQPVIRVSRPVIYRRRGSPVATIATAVVVAGVLLIAAFFACKAAYDEWQLMRVKQELRNAAKAAERALEEMEQEEAEKARLERKRELEERYVPPKY